MSIYRDRPLPSPDGQTAIVPNRAGRYGEAYTYPIAAFSDYAVADEGSYFIASSPTPGTGVIGNVATTFNKTLPYLVLYNGSSSNRLYLDFLRLTTTVVSTGDARVQFTHAIDTGNRYSSGGTALTVNNVNMDSVIASGAVGYHGAITASAASGSDRTLSHQVAKGANIDVVWDIYQFQFGSGGLVPAGAAISSSQISLSFNVHPVILGPGQSYLLYEWAASQSVAPTFSVECGFWVR